MGTEKLYYEDAKLWTFTAVVRDCREAKDGWDIVLDRTAFYPEGGGQPSDRGTLNGLDVLDVQECGGEILHRLARPLLPGEEVRGHVDGAHRFDYMQQHTADHILSGVIHKRYGYDNVGFHMGQESTMIDLSGPLEESDLAEMERVANEAVWMDLPVEASWPEEQTLAQMEYRSKGTLEGSVRLVTIPGVDVCACCGVHVRRTGEVGMIKILSCTRLRGGVRIEYVAGRRAYRYFDAVQMQNHLISVSLSAKPLRTAAAVRRLLEERDAQKERAASMERNYTAALAEQWRGRGDAIVFEETLGADGVRRLADAIKETCGGMALVFSGTDRDGYQYAVAVRDGDVRAYMKRFHEVLGGRGGGREATFVQGSVPAARREIEAYLNGDNALCRETPCDES